MIRFLSALALALTILGAPALAGGLTDMTGAERDAFRAEVRAYLLDNPEVLVEAIRVLDARQAAAQGASDVQLVQTNAAALFQDTNSWAGGNPDGPVMLVEFMDYRCAYCRRAFEEVEALVEGNDDIRFVLKEFPILGEQSTLAARMAIATRQTAGDDAYKAMHDAMMTYGGQFTETTLSALASRLGLDATAIMAAMDSDAVSRVIDANRALGQRMQITGTPTFVLGDQMLRGYVPLAQMQTLVEDVRQRTD